MPNIFKESHAIEITRGDDIDYEIPVTDSNNAAFDFTGWTAFASHVRPEANSENTTLEFTGGNIVATTGKITLTAAKALTAVIAPNTYTYDIEAIDPDTVQRTIIGGTFTILPDVTRV